MRGVCFTLLIAMGFSPTAFAKPCNGVNAKYEIDGAVGFELKFVAAKDPMAWSDLEAELTTPLRKFTYSLTASNGYSINYLVRKEPQQDSTQDEQSYAIHGFDENLGTVGLPQTTKPAPKFILTPEIGSSLWYGQEQREYLPLAMWRLKSCG